jgi:hypothetical protein
LPQATPATTPPVPTRAPDPTNTRIGSGADLRVYNLVTDEGGTRALVLGSELALTCEVGGDPSMPYKAGGGSIVARDWLPGHIVLDSISVNAASGADGRRGRHLGYEEVAGRVSDKVARVTVTFGDTTVQATLMNGTFIARRLHGTTWVPTDGTTAPTAFRAYDAEGRLLNPPQEPGCYATPSGQVISGERADPAKCRRGLPWRP